MDFRGKAVLVTGGSSGIGHSLCSILRANGCQVFSIDKENPKRRIEGVIYLKADITRRPEVKNALQKIRGKIDILINNAGVLRRGALLETDEKDFELMFDVNLKGQWIVLKEATAKMAKDAMMIQMTSRHALELPVDPGIYAISKRACIALAEVYKKDNPHFDVRILCPGSTDTALARNGLDKKTLAKKYMHTPDFVAGNIVEFMTTEYKMLLYDSEKKEYYYR